MPLAAALAVPWPPSVRALRRGLPAVYSAGQPLGPCTCTLRINPPDASAGRHRKALIALVVTLDHPEKGGLAYQLHGWP
jgi:hypothetical protein